MYNNFFNSRYGYNDNRNNNFNPSNSENNNLHNNNYNSNNSNSHNLNENYNPKNNSDNNSNNNNTSEKKDQTNQDIFNNNQLNNIDPIKLKIIMEIREKSKHKSMEELLPEIMKINQELNKRNMNFTKNETAILMDVIEESLSPAEKQRFNMIKGFIN